jgi:hypothetical protein
MNALSRMCAVGLLAAWTPVAAAQAVPAEPGKKAEPTQREEVRKEVDEAVDAIRDYSLERRDEAVARARRAADQFDRDIEEIQAQADARWERMSGAARARSRAAIADLHQRRMQLAEWTGGMRHGSAAAWNEVKTGFVKSYHDLAEALEKTRAQRERDEQQAAPAEDPPPATEVQEEEKR